jgi:ribonuclease HII
LLQFEEQAWQDGFLRVAGLDEAGRGPLAGPVVAGAVIFPADTLRHEASRSLQGLTDSKKLTRKRREHFLAVLESMPEVQCAVGRASVEEIDRLNILRATHLAMQRALAALIPAPQFTLVDGLPVPGLGFPSLALVKGDSRSLSIAAASIVAKVTRDHELDKLAEQYPEYGFAQHHGYGTQAHLEALRIHGPCPEHRTSFRPVRELLPRSPKQPRQEDLFDDLS